jgi:hypothetical protein
MIEAGDGLDVKLNEPEVVAFAQEQLNELRLEGVKFCFVQGDHDLMNPPWFSAVGAETKHLHGAVWDLPGLGKVLGWDYSKEGLNGDTLKALQEVTKGQHIDLTVMHQKWKELLGFDGAWDSTFDSVPCEIKLLLTGDKHGHEQIVHDRKCGKLTVLSPGATCKQSISEPDKHAFYVWMSDGSIKTVPLRSRPVIRVKAVINSEPRFNGLLEGLTTSLEETAKVNQDLPFSVRKPILYVQYTPDVDNFYDRLLDAVNNRAFVFVKELAVKSVTTTEMVQKGEWDRTIEQGLDGALSVVIPLDEDLRNHARRLLNSGDNIREELLALRKEHGLV